MKRIVRPEWLDDLAPDDPAARDSRRDLRLTNAFMGNHRWIARVLPARCRPGEAVIELGAGTGELGRHLQRTGLALDGLDRWPRPVDWPATRTWHQADLRSFPGYAPYSVVVGNLIFHQFTDAELADLGCELHRHARLIVACEPARRRRSQFLYRLIAPLLGASHVSLHDARVSIAAGFRGDELARSLGLGSGDWSIRQHSTVLGANRLIALRNP
jgi:hypothetical protein